MRLLFATTVTHVPDGVGGIKVSIDALIRRLIDRGVAVAVSCAMQRASANPSDAAAGLSMDEILGYPVYRAFAPIGAFRVILDDWRPDIVVVANRGEDVPLAALALDRGLALAFYAHSAMLRDISTLLIERPGFRWLANSAFTANRLRTVLGVAAPVVPLVVEPDRYRVDRSIGADGLPGDSVLMVNPTVLKGAERFFALAEALPHVTFRAIESWDLDPAWRMVLVNRAARLGNVQLWPANDDMREAFAGARLILMPSAHEETFGRAIAEAQLSGIPALASDRGALPETVGPGGRILPLDSETEDWAEALDLIWRDPAHNAALSAAALRHAARPELDPMRVTEAFLGIMRGLLGEK